MDLKFRWRLVDQVVGMPLQNMCSLCGLAVEGASLFANLGKDQSVSFRQDSVLETGHQCNFAVLSE